MAWIAVNTNGTEIISERKGFRESDGFWSYTSECIRLPKGTIKKLVGFDMDWFDKPIELT